MGTAAIGEGVKVKAIIGGKDFKQLVRDVMRVPSGMGSFAGAEMVTLHANDKTLVMMACGTAMAEAKAPAEGGIGLCAVDERVVEGIAGLCRDTSKVIIETDGEKEITLRVRKRAMTVAWAKGQLHKAPAVTGNGIKITADVAQRIRYLSSLAFDDQSRPELSCVMLASTGQASAISQKVAASLKCEAGVQDRVALPVLLAKMLMEGDKVFPDAKETVVKTKTATYCFPSPVKAQKDFPVKMVAQYASADREVVGIVDGAKLALAISECKACLGQLARTEVHIRVKVNEKGILMEAKNGGAEFRAKVPLLKFLHEASMYIPLEESTAVAAFLGEKTQIGRSKTGEVFLTFGLGFCMFPSWGKSK